MYLCIFTISVYPHSPDGKVLLSLFHRCGNWGSERLRWPAQMTQLKWCLKDSHASFSLLYPNTAIPTQGVRLEGGCDVGNTSPRQGLTGDMAQFSGTKRFGTMPIWQLIMFLQLWTWLLAHSLLPAMQDLGRGLARYHPHGATGGQLASPHGILYPSKAYMVRRVHVGDKTLVSVLFAPAHARLYVKVGMCVSTHPRVSTCA